MKESVTLKKLSLYFIPFIPSLIFGFLSYNTAMVTSAGIGLAVLLMVNIDKLQSFKGLGSPDPSPTTGSPHKTQTPSASPQTLRTIPHPRASSTLLPLSVLLLQS